ncbi:MAG: hypothetical protein SPJ16_00820 [Helicobacter sp.]|uniref:hypothetical protein n=1 Tax=Helicobacter sp. TaxID=218 RepID=UPI002A91BD87|nr:hypothetical protein [Helicobacter sp.]MDY5949733.1 hypothetical protein [Helicobacter sp.]
MRKKLSVMAANTLLTIGFGNTALAEENNGLFIGVHGSVSFFGLGMYNYASKAYADGGYKDIDMDKFDAPFNVGLFHVGLKAGYQYFFMSIVGARGYLGYDFNGSRVFVKGSKFVAGMKDINMSFQNITLISCIL